VLSGERVAADESRSLPVADLFGRLPAALLLNEGVDEKGVPACA
jgi:hypothetical protein